MSKKDKALKGIKTPSRRKFFKAAAATGAVAAATLAMPNIAKAATTLKVQAAWGGGIFLENAQAYVKRVNEMAGGALKLDLLPVNSVVKTSQMQDAVHRGVLDGAHYVPAYWYSKLPLLLFSELAHVGVGVLKSCWDGFTTVEAENYIMN